MKSRYSLAPSWAGTARGLLFGRTRELLAPRSWIRVGLLAAALAGVMSLAELKPEGAGGYWAATVHLFLQNVLPLYCLARAGDSLRGELKDGTIEYLWTRPVGRIPLFAGLYLSGLLSVLWTLGVAVVAILATSVLLGEWPGLGGTLALIAGAGLAAVAYAAVSMALAAFSSRYVVLGILYFGLVELGLSRIPTGVREVAVSRHLMEIAGELPEGAGGEFLRSALWMLGIAAFALAVGALTFATKNYSAGGGKEP